MGKHARRKKFLAGAVLGLAPMALLFGHHHHGELGGLTRNADCTLRVPAHPLTALGLSTPYQLGNGNAVCDEGNFNTAAFVQATIYDPATGALSVFDPVVETAGTHVTAPGAPALPKGAVVTVWTGFNGNTLHLVGPGAHEFDQFQQQSYANSIGFFAAVNHGIQNGKVTVPALGMANDGRACPSSRDFSIVDQDQSDNNPEKYANGIGNASDEGTLNTVDAALGCSTWKVPLLDPAVAAGNPAVSPSGPLQELQAAAHQAAPVALIPGADPFALRHGHESLVLQNLLRAEVDQPPAATAGTQEYCHNLLTVGEPRLKLDASTEAMFPNTLPIGNNLANQLAARFVGTWSSLGCTGTDPVTVTLDGNGVAIAATYA